MIKTFTKPINTVMTIELDEDGLREALEDYVQEFFEEGTGDLSFDLFWAGFYAEEFEIYYDYYGDMYAGTDEYQQLVNKLDTYEKNIAREVYGNYVKAHK